MEWFCASMTRRVLLDPEPAHMPHLPRLDLSAHDAVELNSLTKGFPLDAPPTRVGAVAGKGWTLLGGDIPLPAAVIRTDLVTANSRWMAEFTKANDLEIAPHGKTTMTPALFDLQIADGAWAITVATVQQMEVVRGFGGGRVLIANQPVGRPAVAAVFNALSASPRCEVLCLVDSLDGLALLAEGAKAAPPPADNPLRILVEIGFVGGRTGARSRDLAYAIAQAVTRTPGLALAGFECFEGLLPTPDTAQALIDDVVALAQQAIAEGLFAPDQPVVVSAGGSAFFDRVGERFDHAQFGRPVLKVLRSGCYLTHDSIGYAAAFNRMQSETSLTLPPGGLQAALEVWAYVQSRPEPGKAILTMGKRDIGFDAGMPVPLYWYRPDGSMAAPQPLPEGHKVTGLNDQHCHFEFPASSPLAVGDMVGFGNGHPCTTFDKWRLIYMVDPTYAVTRAMQTYF